MSRFLIAISLLLPFHAFGLGLGEHKVNSYLNQPLNLQIPLIDSDGLTADQVRISLADDFYYDQAGLEKAASHSDLSFNVVNRSGQLYVDVTSRKAIKEPYINFITKVDMPNGRVLKEITVLLDPPVFKEPSAPAYIAVPQTPSQPVAPVVQQSVTPEPPVVYEAPATTMSDLPIAKTIPITSSEPPVYTPSVYTPPADTISAFNEPGFTSYSSIYEGGKIRTKKGDRLWEIAEELSGGYHNIQQTLVAIVQKNPHAFIKGNMNRLKANVTLNLPTSDEITQVGLRTARQKYNADLADFNEVRSTTLSSVVEEESVESVTTGKGEVTLKTGDETGEDDSELLTEDLSRAKSENSELKSRVSELNAILAAGDKSLTIQDQELASLEQRLKDLNGGQLPESVKPDTADNKAQSEDAETPKVAAAPKPVDIPKPKKLQSSFFDTIKPFLFPLLALLTLIGGLLFFLKKRKSETVSENPFDSDFDISDLVLDDTDSTAEVAAVEETGSVLEDVERLLSYSLEDKAIELLEDSLTKEPNRQDYRLKLAQLYVDMENKDDFTRIAAPLLESSDAGMRNRVQLMQIKLGIERSVVDADVLMDAPDSDSSFNMDGDDSSTDVMEFDNVTTDLDFDLDSALDSALDGDDLMVNDTDDLDLGIDTSDLDLSIESVQAEITAETSPEESVLDLDVDVSEDTLLGSMDSENMDSVTMDLESLDLDTDGLDFSSDEIDESASDAIQNAEDELEFTLGDSSGSLSVEDTSTDSVSQDMADELNLGDDLDLGDMNLDELNIDDVDAEDVSLEMSDLEGIETFDGIEDIATETVQQTDDADSEETEDTSVETVNEDVAVETDELADLDNEFGFLDDLDENETKLDLAKAYIEMGDSEEAKEILDEVLSEGNEEQKAKAKDLIDRC